MTEDELVSEWGKPARTEPPAQNEHGQTEVIWHYDRHPDTPESGKAVAKEHFTSGTGFFDDPTEAQHIVFHFLDGRLAHWSRTAAEPAPGTEPGAQPPSKPTATDPTKPPDKPTTQPGTPPAKDPNKDPKKGSG